MNFLQAIEACETMGLNVTKWVESRCYSSGCSAVNLTVKEDGSWAFSNCEEICFNISDYTIPSQPSYSLLTGQRHPTIWSGQSVTVTPKEGMTAIEFYNCYMQLTK